MPRALFLRFLLTFSITGFLFPANPGVLFAADSTGTRYEVLNPWGETASLKLTGLSPRLDSLEGKKIGLFANYKRAAIPIAISIKEKLESAYPDSQVSIYNSDKWNVTEIETEKSETFKKWVMGNDAVILMVGD